MSWYFAENINQMFIFVGILARGKIMLYRYTLHQNFI
jgi:hypothetical protein